MRVLNSNEIHATGAGSDVLTIVAVVGLGALIVGLQYFVLSEQPQSFETIDFTALTPKQAYDLGMTHASFYYSHFCFHT